MYRSFWQSCYFFLVYWLWTVYIFKSDCFCIFIYHPSFLLAGAWIDKWRTSSRSTNICTAIYHSCWCVISMTVAKHSVTIIKYSDRRKQILYFKYCMTECFKGLFDIYQYLNKNMLHHMKFLPLTVLRYSILKNVWFHFLV